MDITPYLRLMVENDASDMFFSTGAPVNIKIEGKLEPLGNTRLQPGVAKQIAYSIMSDEPAQGIRARPGNEPGDRGCQGWAASASTCSASAAMWQWWCATSSANIPALRGAGAAAGAARLHHARSAGWC